jgi:thymidylate synthase
MIIEDMPSGYRSVLDAILSEGVDRESRGLSHREITGFQLKVLEPTLSLATGVGRILNPKIAYVEALQLVAGESYPNLLRIVSNGNFDRFVDGEVFHGAYGPRIRPQMPNVIRRLDDQDSRQAVAQIWDPLYDNSSLGRRDLPCTLSFQFLLRNGKLEMVTTMRSNDAWLGLPYDVFQFTQLQATVANVLSVGVGTYTHNVGSMHIYESDLEKTENVFAREATIDEAMFGVEILPHLEPRFAWDLATCEANRVLDNKVAYPHQLPNGLCFKAWRALHA